ncbi:ImmA/IrrE family metallo-endopeptidase [Weissella cibaria]|uniref:ImmA/IrrE family metallo-endopeptidase n=2 Tax=Weissella TaxID=46255 RepID=UPI001C1FB57B|nr:ImmA/IrrE family metallo-endopeptidase [Weissella cibaria]MBU7544725.1 ImmA/IrrE family metallo-endopeptidase [Weissella cibaria]MCV3317702.1 ImmA/IrrE family metallo-endopeptidase [Weissella cibaria]
MTLKTLSKAIDTVGPDILALMQWYDFKHTIMPESVVPEKSVLAFVMPAVDSCFLTAWAEQSAYYYFIFCHEFGHLILHGDRPQKKTCTEESFIHPDELELEANLIAGKLVVLQYMAFHPSNDDMPTAHEFMGFLEYPDFLEPYVANALKLFARYFSGTNKNSSHPHRQAQIESYLVH